jgi:hypothetical protein
MEKVIISVADYIDLQKQLGEINSLLKTISKHDPLREKWLDNQDVCLLLKVSSRTLQHYRDKGVLSFSQFGNKIYYKASDIERHLEKNYIKFK